MDLGSIAALRKCRRATARITGCSGCPRAAAMRALGALFEAVADVRERRQVEVAELAIDPFGRL